MSSTTRINEILRVVDVMDSGLSSLQRVIEQRKTSLGKSSSETDANFLSRVQNTDIDTCGLNRNDFASEVNANDDMGRRVQLKMCAVKDVYYHLRGMRYSRNTDDTLLSDVVKQISGILSSMDQTDDFEIPDKESLDKILQDNRLAPTSFFGVVW